MTISLDTNVVIALWDTHSGMSELISKTCEEHRKSGQVIICGPVFAELLGSPGRKPNIIRQSLEAEPISIDWEFTDKDWQAAGFAYQGYVQRRQSSGSGLPRRMLTDFLIGAHASARNHQMLTLDNRLYRAAFPNLRIETL